jgi:hypothetical protein
VESCSWFCFVGGTGGELLGQSLLICRLAECHWDSGSGAWWNGGDLGFVEEGSGDKDWMLGGGGGLLYMSATD